MIQIIQLLSLLQAAMIVAPKAVEVAVNAKNLIKSLTEQGMIPVEEQARVDAFVDAIDALVNNNIVPDAWLVEEDPE